MSKITIHDSTCRDGQHGVRHQLTASQIGRYAKAAEAAGVPIVYVSHGNGLSASSIHLDPALLPDRQMLLAARKHLNKTKLAENYGYDGVFLMDSAGASMTEDVFNKVDWLLHRNTEDHLNIPLGYH